MMQYNSPLSFSILLGLGLLVPSNIMTNSLYKVYVAVTKAQQLLAAQGFEHTQAKAQYVKMVKKLFIFVLNINTCSTPIIVCAIWEYITNQYPPPALDIIAMLAAASNPCILNPIFLILLNHEVKDAVYNKLYLISLLFTKTIKIYPKHIILKPKSIYIGGLTMSDYDDPAYWMSDETLFNKFKEYGKSVYVIENLLFSEEVEEFKNIGQRVHELLNSLTDDTPKHAHVHAIIQPTLGSNFLAKKVTDEWTKLHEKAFRIYKLYIEVPSAPLEINISHELRMKLLNYLRTILSNPINENPTMISELVLIHEFPNITEMNTNERKCCLERLVHIFDDVLKVIMKIIDTDIFPRFKKTNLFERTKKEHLKQTQSQIKV